MIEPREEDVFIETLGAPMRDLVTGLHPGKVKVLRDNDGKARGVVVDAETYQQLVRRQADAPRPLSANDVTPPHATCIEERVLRRQTIQVAFGKGDWLTSEDVNRLQASPPRDKSLPVVDWKRRAQIFGVLYEGVEYFARYQFDDYYQPKPVIANILRELGEVFDTWKIAAWFHYPNGWIVDLVDGTKPTPPKNALDRPDAVLMAARRMRETYQA